MHAYVRHLETLTDDDGHRVLAASSVARAVVSVRSFHRFCAREGFVEHDPSQEVGAPPVPAGHPEGARRGRGRSACCARSPATIRSRNATGRCSSCCTAPGSASARRSVSTSTTSISKTARCGCSARARRSGSCPSGRGARVAVEAYLRDGRLALRAPAARRTTRDGDAVVLNARGGRLSRQSCWTIVRRAGERVGLDARPVAARAAAFLCHPHARPRRRSAGRAGAARPRQHLDDAGVHEGVARTAAGGLRRRAPACAHDHRTRPERATARTLKRRTRG